MREKHLSVNHSERSRETLWVFSQLNFSGCTNILQFHWFKTESLISPSAHVHPPHSRAAFPFQRTSRPPPFCHLLPVGAANSLTSCAKLSSHPTPASREWGKSHPALHCGSGSHDRLDACARLRSGSKREHLGGQAGAAVQIGWTRTSMNLTQTSPTAP